MACQVCLAHEGNDIKGRQCPQCSIELCDIHYPLHECCANGLDLIGRLRYQAFNRFGHFHAPIVSFTLEDMLTHLEFLIRKYEIEKRAYSRGKNAPTLDDVISAYIELLESRYDLMYRLSQAHEINLLKTLGLMDLSSPKYA